MLSPQKLAESLVEGFDMDELEALAFQAGVRFENLKGDTLSAKARALTKHCGRRGTLDALIVAARTARPNMYWSATPHADVSSATLTSGTSKLTGMQLARVEARQYVQAQCLRQTKTWVGAIGATNGVTLLLVLILLVKAMA